MCTAVELVEKEYELLDKNSFFESQLDGDRDKTFDILAEDKVIVRNKIDPLFGHSRSSILYQAGYL